MGAEIAERGGFGTVVIDVRRDGPKSAFDCTFGALAATDTLIAHAPETAAAAVRAVVAAQRALAEEPSRAIAVGRTLFPPEEAELIAELVRRDAPYYDATITPATVVAMNRFARRMGVLPRDVPFEAVVATELAPLWAVT
jgi:NitT/TauT family transport system substrate-binding protein